MQYPAFSWSAVATGTAGTGAVTGGLTELICHPAVPLLAMNGVCSFAETATTIYICIAN
jgi:hypothetical protein